MTKYEIIVGNIGTVYSGSSLKVAISVYGAYKELSKQLIGRTSGETVTFIKDGKPQ